MHMAQLMPLPLTVSCSSKIQIGFTFLVPAYPGCPGKEAVNWLQLQIGCCIVMRCLCQLLQTCFQLSAVCLGLLFKLKYQKFVIPLLSLGRILLSGCPDPLGNGHFRGLFRPVMKYRESLPIDIQKWLMPFRRLGSSDGPKEGITVCQVRASIPNARRGNFLFFFWGGVMMHVQAFGN